MDLFLFVGITSNSVCLILISFMGVYHFPDPHILRGLRDFQQLIAIGLHVNSVRESMFSM